MKILTHNSLKCPAKEVAAGYPLQLEIEEMEVNEFEPNLDFIRGVLPSLDWPGVLIAAKAVGLDSMPAQFEESLLGDESFLLAMHHLLLNVNVLSGALVCPETGRRFPIENGIADMRYTSLYSYSAFVIAETHSFCLYILPESEV